MPTLSNKQYGFVREVHADADPATVMTLLGPDADLLAFTANLVPRTNTPGAYLDLVTRYQGGGAGGGCASCAYDPLGNPLSVTDGRGNTTTYDRNELGEVYRVTAPAPYNYQTETHYDANRNVIRVDTRDVQVAYASADPADPAYATFTPTGSGATANLPTRPGSGGAVRPGWFTNLYAYDLLDDKTQEDLDATGSSPANLVTRLGYDFNQNLVLLTKPLGNTIEFDYDERNLKIATRIGGPSGSVTVMAYDGNGNLTDVLGPDTLGPAARGSADQTLTAVLGDAFGGSTSQTFSGDWLTQNAFDGLDRLLTATDAAGGYTLTNYDPGNRVVSSTTLGSGGGPTPADRGGSADVRLASGRTRCDEAGRPYETQRDVFLDGGAYYGIAPTLGLPSGRTATHAGGGLAANSTSNNHAATATLTAGGTSYVLSRNVFDRAGRLTASAADNGALTTFSLDGAGRQLATTDALGNVVRNSFDANGNVTLSTRVEKCTISDSIPAESFASAMKYDVLGRLVLLAQQGPDGLLDPTLNACCVPPAVPNQTILTLWGYDSRNNRTNGIDPKGNTSAWEFDGANRPLRDLRHLRADGAGGNPVTHTVTTQTSYDANGNTIRLVDGNGGTTTWAYDAQDRQSGMTFHDGSTRTRSYDPASGCGKRVGSPSSKRSDPRALIPEHPGIR